MIRRLLCYLNFHCWCVFKHEDPNTKLVLRAESDDGKHKIYTYDPQPRLVIKCAYCPKEK